MKGLSKKNIFKSLFALLAVVLMLLPFVNVFNHLLTRVVENTGFYHFIELYLTPHIIKMVMAILGFLNIKTRFGQTMFLVYHGGEKLPIYISWNCLGWQSLVIFLVSLFAGFSGRYTWLSKLECLLIGILGTFLLNIIRIVVSVLAIVFVNQLFAFVFHDYLMILVTILWLFGFWYFSYSFVLEEQIPKTRIDAT